MSDKRRRSVSMTEEVFIALNVYTDHLNASGKTKGKPLTPTGVNTKILLGDIPPIPERFLEDGKAMARIKEKERAKEPPPEPKEPGPGSEFFSGVNSF